MVFILKARLLTSEKSIQQWFIDLKSSTAPTTTTTRQTIKTKYKKLINTRLENWPMGDPAKWLAT